MLKAQAHFEQIPLEAVRKIAEEEFQLGRMSAQAQGINKERAEKGSAGGARQAKSPYAYATPAFDIFEVESDGGVLWLEAVTTFADAKTRVRELGASSRRDYLILNERTGEKTVVKSAAQGGAQDSNPQFSWEKAYREALRKDEDLRSLSGKVLAAESAILQRLQELRKAPQKTYELIAAEGALDVLLSIKTEKLKFPSWKKS